MMRRPVDPSGRDWDPEKTPFAITMDSDVWSVRPHRRREVMSQHRDELIERYAAILDEEFAFTLDLRHVAQKLVAVLDEAAKPAPGGPAFDLVAHLQRQRDFSEKTFGPGARTAGVLDHIRKELLEIEADPNDIREWVDVIILAFDGAWRAGWKAEDIVAAIVAKQTKNEGRTWPDWRTAPAGKAIEHDRSGEPAPGGPKIREDFEEAVRLAEIGEFLYDARAYSYGDGRTEPREYGIDWQWQQSKPDDPPGQGVLLVEATRWHDEQAENGTITEARKLRAALLPAPPEPNAAEVAR